MTLKSGLVVVGLEPVCDTTIDAAHEALTRAEAFGDNFALVCGLWAYGSLLLRLDNRAGATAIEHLKRAKSIIIKHRTVALSLAPIEADLAVGAARAGNRDVAIESLREVIRRQFEDLNLNFVGATTTAFVQLLVDRGDTADIAEATALVTAMDAQGSQLKLPPLQFSAAFGRVVIARAGDDEQAYAAAIHRYREALRQAGTRGRFLELHSNQDLPQIT
jgi:adenylate cyclase